MGLSLLTHNFFLINSLRALLVAIRCTRPRLLKLASYRTVQDSSRSGPLVDQAEEARPKKLSLRPAQFF